MSEKHHNILIDGFGPLPLGCNEGQNPSLLVMGDPFSATQAARLVNVTVRGGYPTHRPPVIKSTLFFQNQQDQDWFETQNVQGRIIFTSPHGTFNIVSIGGRIYRIDPRVTNAPNVLDLTIDGDPNPSVLPHVWMCQAENYLVIQDGQSIPLIYDGATLRRSRMYAPDYEVPVGRAMTYGLGRLIVVLAHKRAYAIGDIVNGGTEVIQFTETNFLAEGGTVTCPVPGDITAVKIIAQMDRGVGQGDLIVFTRSGAAAAKIGEKRETWKNILFQPVVMIGPGATSQDGVTLVNGDMFYRASDGIRSLAMAQRDSQSSWAMTPISREVSRTLSFDTPWMLDYAQTVLFDNRLLTLCNQSPLTNGCFHRGLVALDFDTIGSIGQKSTPAYDGLWIGLNVTAIMVGEFNYESRCFLFHRNSDNRNEMWELLKDGYLDNNTNRIRWTVEGASILKQGSTPQSLKRLEGGDVSFEKVQGALDWEVQFKPDQAPCWYNWHSDSACAAVNDCSVSCPVSYQPQYRAKKRFPQPPDTASISDNKPARNGYEFQTRLIVTGHAVLHMLRIGGVELDEPFSPLDGCGGE